MWLVFFVVCVFMGILLSSIELELVNIDVTEKKCDFKWNILLKIFYFLKIKIFVLDKYGIKFFNKTFLYKNLILNKSTFKLNNEIIDLIKKLNIKINKSEFEIYVGLIDITPTNIAVVMFSSIMPCLLKKNNKKIKYKILPEYNRLHFKFNGKISISISILNLLKFYFKNIKREITHNKYKNYEVKESL